VFVAPHQPHIAVSVEKLEFQPFVPSVSGFTVPAVHQPHTVTVYAQAFNIS